MERFNGQALNLQDVRIPDVGDPLGYADINAPDSSTTITVRNVSDGLLSTIYSDNVLSTKTNPFNTDNKGKYHFYAANGRYNIVIDEDLSTEETIGDVILFDYEDLP